MRILILLLFLLCSCQKAEHKDVFGTISEDKAVLYNETAQVIVHNIATGTRVKIDEPRVNVELSGKQFESVTKVMLPNANGDFVNGFEGYIPVRKVKLDRPELLPYAPYLIMIIMLLALFFYFVSSVSNQRMFALKEKADKYDELYARATELEKKLRGETVDNSII